MNKREEEKLKRQQEKLKKELEKCLYEQRVNDFLNGYLDEMESMFG